MDSLWEEAKKAQHHSSIHPFIFLLPISKTNPIARNISSSSPTHNHLSSTSFTSCSFIILPIITLDHLTSTCRTTSSIFYPSLTHSKTAATTEQNRRSEGRNDKRGEGPLRGSRTTAVATTAATLVQTAAPESSRVQSLCRWRSSKPLPPFPFPKRPFHRRLRGGHCSEHAGPAVTVTSASPSHRVAVRSASDAIVGTAVVLSRAAGLAAVRTAVSASSQAIAAHLSLFLSLKLC